jgi:hypothetical protein
MLRRLFALLLLILTASPFTAPFATCDVTTLFGDGVSTVPVQATVASAVEDGSHAVPMCAASSGIRCRIRTVSRTVTAVEAPGFDGLAAPQRWRARAGTPGIRPQSSSLALRI